MILPSKNSRIKILMSSAIFIGSIILGFSYLSCQAPSKIDPRNGPHPIKIKITAVDSIAMSAISDSQRVYCAEAFKVNYIVLSKDSLRDEVPYKIAYFFNHDTFEININYNNQSYYPGPYYIAKYQISEDKIFTGKYTEFANDLYSLIIDSIDFNDAFEKDICQH